MALATHRSKTKKNKTKPVGIFLLSLFPSSPPFSFLLSNRKTVFSKSHCIFLKFHHIFTYWCPFSTSGHRTKFIFSNNGGQISVIKVAIMLLDECSHFITRWLQLPKYQTQNFTFKIYNSNCTHFSVLSFFLL
jgi:hypothetical protein